MEILNRNKIVDNDVLLEFEKIFCETATNCLSDYGYIGEVRIDGVWIHGETAEDAQMSISVCIEDEPIIDIPNYPLEGHTTSEDFVKFANGLAYHAASRIHGLIKYRVVPYCKVWQVDHKNRIRCVDVGELVSRLIGNDIISEQVREDLEKNGHRLTEADVERMRGK